MDASQEIDEYPSDRGQVVPRSRGIRSRITNGSKMLPDVDGRSTVARRYRDISSAIVADQGSGGTRFVGLRSSSRAAPRAARCTAA